MLKIQRQANGGVLFTLSGRIEAEDVGELRRLLELEEAGSHIALDLKDVTLVDRDESSFWLLAKRTASSSRIVRLTSVNGLGGRGCKNNERAHGQLHRREQDNGLE